MNREELDTILRSNKGAVQFTLHFSISLNIMKRRSCKSLTGHFTNHPDIGMLFVPGNSRRGVEIGQLLDYIESVEPVYPADCGDVYQREAFWARVNFAAKVIAEGLPTSRHFDTCFEMNDGGTVCVALHRRAQKNKRLSVNLAKYISLYEDDLERLKDVKTRDLPEAARQERTRHQSA
jgi:hypothetical protein